MTAEIIRCSWCGDDPLYRAYHDHEWGKPVHDDRLLFESLILGGAQAGLSWIIVLRKRENYRRLFYAWDIQRIARMSDDELEKILLDPGVIRNRLKIYAVRTNARVAQDIIQEWGSLDQYFWGSHWFYLSSSHKTSGVVREKGTQTFSHFSPFLEEKLGVFPIIHHPRTFSELPTESDISRIISRDLKRRGMSFVGSIIIYAFMQAIGMIDDHVDDCFFKSQEP